MISKRVILTVFALLAFAFTMHAQLNGRLTGTVVDPSGAAIPNATVGLYLAGGQSALLSTQTNAEGFFDFAAVRPELYNVVVESSGFTKRTLTGVKIDPARQTAMPPIQLELPTAAQAIEVSASAQTVDTATAEVATTVSQSQITNLPVLDRQISNLFVT